MTSELPAPYKNATPVAMDVIWGRTCIKCAWHGSPHVFMMIINGTHYLRCENCDTAMVARALIPEV